MRPTSLDLSLNEGGEDSLESIVPDEFAADAAAALSDREDLELMRVCVAESLTEREQMIICLRFGLDGGPRQTLDEIGTQIGITRERVRQLQNIALKKVREAMHQRDSGVTFQKTRREGGLASC